MSRPLSLQSRKYWMPDDLCKSCSNCDQPFTFLRRRHHCRFCGKIFCNACSNETMDGAQFGVKGDLRVCVKCKAFEKMLPAVGTPTGVRDSSGRPGVGPAPLAPFVPLFAQPTTPEDDQVLAELLQFGNDYISFLVVQSLSSPDIHSNMLSSGLPDEAACRAVGSHWEAMLFGLITTAMSLVDPNCRVGWPERTDFLHYVKVKTIPGGVADMTWAQAVPPGSAAASSPAPPKSVLESVLPGTCEFIDGVMFRKALPHKLMRSDISQPRILLLDDALEFDGAGELTRLDNLVDQEEQYTKIMAKKIVALQPDIVFTSKNASRSAWDTLRTYANVTLVPGVKPTVMNRLSRMSGAPILPSINHLDKVPEWQAIGRSEKFAVQSIFVPNPGSEAPVDPSDHARFRDRRNRVNYMVLEGSSTSATPTAIPGCTLLLRGGRTTLRFAKAIVRWVLYCAYNLRLERALMYDTGAMPTHTEPAAADGSASEGLSAHSSPSSLSPPAAPAIMSSSPGVCIKPKGAQTAAVSDVEIGNRGLNSSSGPAAAADAEKPTGHENVIPLSVGLAWSYQSLQMLHVDTVDGTQCRDPALFRNRFYSSQDRSLKRFLETCCFDLSVFCQHCKKPQHKHIMTFSHANGRVEVHVLRGGGGGAPVDEDPAVTRAKEDASAALHAHAGTAVVPPDGQHGDTGAPRRRVSGFMLRDSSSMPAPPPLPTHTQPGYSPNMMVCAVCTKCAAVVSSWRPVSRGTQQYSLGKFMEMHFYNDNLKARDKRCSHSPRDCHVRFFARHTIVAAFRYVPLRAYKILRPTRIRFDKHWAVKTRCDVLRSLYSTAGERSSRQIGMLGDMFKTASQLEAPPATMASLKRLQERVVSLRDSTMELLQFVLDAETSTTPAVAPLSFSSSSSECGLDVATFLASSPLDVLAATYLMQSWHLLSHGIETDIVKYEGILTRASRMPIPLASPALVSIVGETLLLEAHPATAQLSIPAPVQPSAPLDTIPLASFSDLIHAPVDSPPELPPQLGTGNSGAEQQASPVAAEPSTALRPTSGTSDTSTLTDEKLSAPVHGTDPVVTADLIAAAPHDPPVRTRSGETTVSSAPPPPPLLHAPSSLTHRTSLPLPDLSLPEPSDPTRLFPPPLAPGKHSTLLPGLQGCAVMVDNAMLSSAVAYSLSSGMYWRQMARIVEFASERFRDFEEAGPEMSDDDSVSTVGAGSVHSAEGNAPNIRLPIVTKHSLDDTDLPHSVSEPVSPPGRYHGRQRSRSLVMSPRRPPMAVLEPGLTLAGLTHSDRPRLEKQESEAGPRSPPASRRRTVGTVFPATGPTRSRRRSTLSRANKDPRDALAALVGSTPKPGPLSALVHDVFSRGDSDAPAASSPDTRNRGAHRARSSITPSISQASNTAYSSSKAALSLPVKGTVPDTLPEPPQAPASTAAGAPLPSGSSTRKLTPLSVAQQHKSVRGGSLTNSTPAAAAALAWGKDSSFGNELPLDSERMLISDVQGDVIHTFTDKTPGNEATFVVTSYWAMQFHGLRDLVCESPRSYVQSLAFCRKWATSGGKSGASFEMTENERFVVKYVKPTELDMFVHNGAKFFAHQHKVLFRGQQSLMARYMGAYKVVTILGPGNGKKTTSCMVVLENLFYRRSIQDGLKFDLKGKGRSNRPKQAQPTSFPLISLPDGAALAGGAGGPVPGAAQSGMATPMPTGSPASVPSTTPASNSGGGVLLDDDFLARLGGQPTVLDEASKLFLNQAVDEDTRFLASLKVIDYSLLVGIDEVSGDIVVGLIDYVRRYDWMSKMEFGVKRSIATAEPTVVRPERYRDRFCHAMERYFVHIPDRFSVLDCGVPRPAPRTQNEEEEEEGGVDEAGAATTSGDSFPK